MMAKKSPNPTDKYVGSRVRMRRLMLGMSQEKLGEKLGLTFQQVQKYEKGTNRIGASRLPAHRANSQGAGVVLF
jgi:transcriptional regulator with XRE-family HTH domain